MKKIPLTNFFYLKLIPFYSIFLSIFFSIFFFLSFSFPASADHYHYNWIKNGEKFQCKRFSTPSKINNFFDLAKTQIVTSDYCLKYDTVFSWYLDSVHLKIGCHAIAKNLGTKLWPVEDIRQCRKSSKHFTLEYLEHLQSLESLENLEEKDFNQSLSDSIEEAAQKNCHSSNQDQKRIRAIDYFLSNNIEILEKYFSKEYPSLFPERQTLRKKLSDYLDSFFIKPNPEKVNSVLAALHKSLWNYKKQHIIKRKVFNDEDLEVLFYSLRNQDQQDDESKGNFPLGLISEGNGFVFSTETFGSGGQKIVFRGFDMEEGRPVALPYVKGASKIEGMKNELEHLKFLKGQNPHIAHPLTFFHDKSLTLAPYPLYPLGDLAELMENGQGLKTQEEIVVFAARLADGLHFLHKNNIIHRDIKPDNILIDQDPSTLELIPKIHDFGLSYRVSSTSSTSFANKMGGTLENVSHHYVHRHYHPKTYTEEQKIMIDKSNDIWALGLILYKLVLHKNPDFLRKIKSEAKDVLSITGADIVASTNLLPPDHKLTPLIKHLLNPNYYDRPTAETLSNSLNEILKNEYLRSL